MQKNYENRDAVPASVDTSFISDFTERRSKNIFAKIK